MSNALDRIRYGGGRLAAQHGKAVAAIEQEVRLTEEKIAGLNRAGRTAVAEGTLTGLATRMAMEMDPDRAQLYHHTTVTVALETIELLHDLGRSLR